jgi:hypothetical protein
MITPREIKRFPLTRQIEIQEEIKKYTDMGRPLRYLMLSSDGTVIYDDILHMEAMMTGFDPESDGFKGL